MTRCASAMRCVALSSRGGRSGVERSAEVRAVTETPATGDIGHGVVARCHKIGVAAFEAAAANQSATDSPVSSNASCSVRTGIACAAAMPGGVAQALEVRLDVPANLHHDRLAQPLRFGGQTPRPGQRAQVRWQRLRRRGWRREDRAAVCECLQERVEELQRGRIGGQDPADDIVEAGERCSKSSAGHDECAFDDRPIASRSGHVASQTTSCPGAAACCCVERQSRLPWRMARMPTR